MGTANLYLHLDSATHYFAALQIHTWASPVPGHRHSLGVSLSLWSPLVSSLLLQSVSPTGASPVPVCIYSLTICTMSSPEYTRASTSLTTWFQRLRFELSLSLRREVQSQVSKKNSSQVSKKNSSQVSNKWRNTTGSQISNKSRKEEVKSPIISQSQISNKWREVKLKSPLQLCEQNFTVKSPRSPQSVLSEEVSTTIVWTETHRLYRTSLWRDINQLVTSEKEEEQEQPKEEEEEKEEKKEQQKETEETEVTASTTIVRNSL